MLGLSGRITFTDALHDWPQMVVLRLADGAVKRFQQLKPRLYGVTYCNLWQVSQ
jgi:hypothetical protein